MDAALVSTWDSPARGREQQALQVFMDSMEFWARQAEAGRCSEQEVLLSNTGKGMSIVKGDSTALQEIIESDEWQELGSRVMVNVDGWELQIWGTGDQIQRAIETYSRTVASL